MGKMRLIPLFATALLAACTTLEPGPVGKTNAVNPVTGELRTQPALELPQNTEISAETGVVAGALAIFGHPVPAIGLPGDVFSPSQTPFPYSTYDSLEPN